MDKIALVSDVMTSKVLSVHPDTPILDTAKVIYDNKFAGVPVIDKENRLVGLVTEFSLISEKSLLHLPTLQTVLQNLPSETLTGDFIEQIKKIAAIQTSDVMDKTPLTLFPDDTFEAAIELFNAHHRINPVPVIDHDKKLVGVLARYDLIKLLKIYGHV